MNYHSFGFIVFTLLVWCIYYVMFARYRKIVIFISSILFLFLCGIQYIPFVAITLVNSFMIAKLIGEHYEKMEEELKKCIEREKKKEIREEAKKYGKKILLIGMSISLGMLGIFKYTMFVFENINMVLKVWNIPQIPLFKLILPIGISFYTFMAVSYILDVYWRRYVYEKNFLNYALYLTYFPHILQGPISRFDSFKSQFEKNVKPNYQTFTRGGQLLLWGLFKKIVIADRLGIFVSKIYDNYTEYTGMIFIIATFFYSIQIYTDFSGCIDIISGVSEALGISLTKNFNHPYFSKTMPEFWRRWHISLGAWFKDYLYYPISISGFLRKIKKYYKDKGNKKIGDTLSSVIPTIAVWLATGIWHGAAWKYVVWGLYHATLIVLGIIFEERNKKICDTLQIKTDTFSWRLFQILRTFVLCSVGRVFFRAKNLQVAIEIFSNTFQHFTLEHVVGGKVYEHGLNRQNFQFACACIVLLFFVEIMQERMSIRGKIAEQNIVFRWLIYYLAIFSIVIFGIYGATYDAASFIYGQF